MKKNLVTLMTILALISCDKEAVPEKEQTAQNLKIKSVESESMIQGAETSDPSETKGKRYYSLVTEYTQKYGFPNSIQELTNQVRYIVENWENKQEGLEARQITQQYMYSIMYNPNEKLADILKNAPISKEAGTSLKQLIEKLIELSGQDYKDISDFIDTYQEAVKENTALTDEEKEIIVNIAVISNYALYAESGRKDRDWETSVANKKVPSFFNRNQAPIIAVIALIDQLI